DRLALQHRRRARRIRDQRKGRVRGWRLPPRTEPGGVGDQRGSRRRARVRSLFDGQHRSALARPYTVTAGQGAALARYAVEDPDERYTDTGIVAFGACA